MKCENPKCIDGREYLPMENGVIITGCYILCPTCNETGRETEQSNLSGLAARENGEHVEDIMDFTEPDKYLNNIGDESKPDQESEIREAFEKDDLKFDIDLWSKYGVIANRNDMEKMLFNGYQPGYTTATQKSQAEIEKLKKMSYIKDGELRDCRLGLDSKQSYIGELKKEIKDMKYEEEFH